MGQFSAGVKYRQMVLVAFLFPVLVWAQLVQSDNIQVGADRPGAFLPLLYNKKVAVVANQTSMTSRGHLVDFLVASKMDVKKVFAPEHGFRGTASAGEHIKDGKDEKTGLPVISLYGNNKKPTDQQLSDVDVVVFDLQDVGARFYTYISTLNYVMLACAENNKKLVVLDRPNPNGYFVDGPMLQKGFESFVGMNPVPVVHGLTIGEYAKMINGEGWLPNGVKCDLDVVRCSGWDHKTAYELPIKPSPNLPNQLAVALYPSLCFFEGTTVSVGRGTDKPFQQIGAPYFTESNITFIPRSNEGATHPKYEGEVCKGFDLTDFGRYYISGSGEIYLYWLIEAYKLAPDKEGFFNSNNFFDKLAGTDKLRKAVMAGQSAEQIRDSWQAGLAAFKEKRAKYLLYRNFE